jgi:hypothetical protein
MSDGWKGTTASRRPSPALLVACIAVLAGLVSCASSQPFSYLDGYRWNRAELYTYDTLIAEVDGTSYAYNSKIRVDPGRHHIVLETQPVAGFSVNPRKALDLDVEPCVRYWFEAKRANALTQDFEPRVNYKEPIAGCGLASNTPTEPRKSGY